MKTAPVSGGTTARDKSNSYNELLKTIRAALLDYADSNGTSARDAIKERLYQQRAPDATYTFPYAVMSLSLSNDGTHHGMRYIGGLEVMVYGKPYAQLEAVNDLCDLFQQSMLAFISHSKQLIFCRAQDRQPVPAGGDAVDGEVVAVRLSYTLVVWPAYLTSLTRVLT